MVEKRNESFADWAARMEGDVNVSAGVSPRRVVLGTCSAEGCTGMVVQITVLRYDPISGRDPETADLIVTAHWREDPLPAHCEKCGATL